MLSQHIFIIMHTSGTEIAKFKRTHPSKMRISTRAVRATIMKFFLDVQKYPKHLKFAYFYEKIKTRFSKPFRIQQIFEKVHFLVFLSIF